MADEGAADCEEGQWSVGHRTTRAAFLALENATRGTGVGYAACEGEHWDGQDTVHRDEAWSCTPYVDPQPGSAALAWCLPSDPNLARGDDPLSPLGARASTRDLREVYLAANVAFVARVAVYAGACGAGGRGLEGETECRGAQEARAGIYARDNTPGNIVATATCTRVVGCWYPESDCSYETYEASARSGERYCSRDNTAFGAMLVLP